MPHTAEIFQLIAKEVPTFFEHFKIVPINIPTEFSLMYSQIQGEAIEMHSQAWTSEVFAYLRLTRLKSPQRIQLFNFTVYPSTSYEIPVFASDFVVLQENLRIGVIDAMPIFGENPQYVQTWVNPFEEYYQRSLEIAPVYERKQDWSFNFLGKCACLATQLPASKLPSLVALWRDYLTLYLQIATGAKKIDEATQAKVTAWHNTYNQQHREVEIKRNPLLHYFGEALGTRYVKEFLFNDSLH